MSTGAAQAAQVAGAASEATANLASTAKAEGANVIGEGLDQARDLVSTVRDQVAGQVDAQADRLTEALRSLSTQLSEGDTSGFVGQVMKEAASRVQSFADFADRTGPEGLLTEFRSYAKRNPGTFLLGAVVTGLVTGRVVRGMTGGKASAQQKSPGSPPTYRSPLDATGAALPLGTAPTAAAAPLASGRPAAPYETLSSVPEPVSAPPVAPIPPYPPAPIPPTAAETAPLPPLGAETDPLPPIGAETDPLPPIGAETDRITFATEDRYGTGGGLA